MQRFIDKTVLITGGTSGIGLATAQRLLKEGARVIVTGSRDSSIAKAKDLLGGTVHYLRNDAGDSAGAAALAAAVKALVPTLDGAFLNAGFGNFAPVGAITAESFDAQYAVNVRGPLLHAQALSPLMAKGGAFLLNTSVAHEKGFANMAVYASTKGAVRTLTRVLARELAPNVRVNAVSPGPIVTAFFDRSGLPPEVVAEFGASVQAQVPLGRFGTGEEVAAVAAFLLSQDASYVTGAEYAVDGGFGQL